MPAVVMPAVVMPAVVMPAVVMPVVVLPERELLDCYPNMVADRSKHKEAVVAAIQTTMKDIVTKATLRIDFANNVKYNIGEELSSQPEEAIKNDMLAREAKLDAWLSMLWKFTIETVSQHEAFVHILQSPYLCGIYANAWESIALPSSTPASDLAPFLELLAMIRSFCASQAYMDLTWQMSVSIAGITYSVVFSLHSQCLVVEQLYSQCLVVEQLYAIEDGGVHVITGDDVKRTLYKILNQLICVCPKMFLLREFAIGHASRLQLVEELNQYCSHALVFSKDSPFYYVCPATSDDLLRVGCGFFLPSL
jgi:hypothetical protein